MGTVISMVKKMFKVMFYESLGIIKVTLFSLALILYRVFLAIKNIISFNTWEASKYDLVGIDAKVVKKGTFRDKVSINVIDVETDTNVHSWNVELVLKK